MLKLSGAHCEGVQHLPPSAQAGDRHGQRATPLVVGPVPGLHENPRRVRQHYGPVLNQVDQPPGGVSLLGRPEPLRLLPGERELGPGLLVQVHDWSAAERRGVSDRGELDGDVLASVGCNHDAGLTEPPRVQWRLGSLVSSVVDAVI